MEDAAFSGAIFFFAVSHFVFSDASSVDIYLNDDDFRNNIYRSSSNIISVIRAEQRDVTEDGWTQWR